MKFKSIYIFLLLSVFTANSQVGIGTTSPNASLDIPATSVTAPISTDGLLIPRVDTFPTINPGINQNGMLIFLNNTVGIKSKGFYYWDFSLLDWIAVGKNNTSGWSLTGNTGTIASVNFLGTTDNVDVVFRRNNIRAALLAIDNTSFGTNSLNTASTGTQNTALGSNVLTSNTTGFRNTAIGENTMFLNTTGQENIAIGVGALYSNTIGNQNTVLGRNAMTTNATGSSNTALGYLSLRDNTIGGFNTSVGRANLITNTIGVQNSSVGAYGLFENTIGNYNSSIGVYSLRSNSTGNYNTALGYQSLFSNSTGSLNVGLGNQAGYFETGSNKLYIENSNADSNAALVYGEFDNKIIRANGQLQIFNPAITGYALPIVRGTNGQLLQTNGAGATNWVSASTLNITETDPQVSAVATNAVTRWNGTTLVDGTIQDDGTNVGIGTSPTVGNKLEVNGKTQTTNFQMTSGATNGYILQSDAVGNSSWVPNPLTTLSIVRTNLSVNQTLATTGWQKITFDTVAFDTNSEFITGTNRFVSTKTGYYEINAGYHTFNKNDVEQYAIAVYVNGIEYQETATHHYGDKLISRIINCTVSLAVNDYVEIFIFNGNAPTTIDGYSGKTYFEVKQIR